MKYEVTYKCGHTGTVELFGKESDREYRLSRMAEEDCPDCQKAAVHAMCAEQAERYGLPDLVGSPKQIAWAEEIRAEFIAKKEEQSERNEQVYARALAANIPNAQEQIDKMRALFDGFCAEFFAETSARKWIDLRDKANTRDFANLLNDYASRKK